MKKCSNCNLLKSEEEYNKSSFTLDKLYCYCRECDKKYKKEYRNTEEGKKKKTEYSKKYYSKNKDRIKKKQKDNPNIHRNTKLKKNFGIDLNQYNEMLNNQNKKCAICYIHESELIKKLAVDHCHKTGKIRGLLCMKCNIILGQAKDNIKILNSAISYLEKVL